MEQTENSGAYCYPDAFLDEMRLVGDPPGDTLIAEIFAEREAEEVSALLVQIQRNASLMPEDMPEPVRGFLECSAILPVWHEPVLLEAGGRLFSRYGLQIVAALHCAALPECYLAAKGVQVLAATQRLYKNAYRRIMQTAQFVLDVMAPGGLGPEGMGVRSAQKVRILHSTIRYHLDRTKALDPAYGVPINQEDLVGTLMAFSVCILDSLTLLRIDLTDFEREAYLHTWKVVGHLLGIDQRLLPPDCAAARHLTERIRARQWAETQAGKDLTKALIDYMQDMIPGEEFDGFPAVLMRHFMGDEVADKLGVPPKDWTEWFVAPFRLFSGVTDEAADHFSILGHLTGLAMRKMLEVMHSLIMGGKRPEWRIPGSLREEWGLKE